MALRFLSSPPPAPAPARARAVARTPLCGIPIGRTGVATGLRLTAAVLLAAGVVTSASFRAAAEGDKPAAIRAPHAEIELAPLAFGQDGSPVLRLTMRPRAGIHIYAPGQRGYYPLSITFPPDAGLAAGRLDLPPAEPYVFAPTGEKFLVYRETFSLTQHAAPVRGRGAAASVAPRAKQRPTIVRATLHYQACDEEVCYRPVAVPLAWTRDAAATPMPKR